MIILYFLLGSIIASFMNVVIDRLPRHISFIKGRSYCPYCHHTLHALDLIPIISFLLLKGRCRYCHLKIHFFYPLYELVGGITFLIFYYFYGFTLYSVLLFILFEVFLVISIIDIKTMIIPDILVITIFVISLFLMPYHYVLFMDRFIGFLIGLSFCIMNIIKKDSFGGGDIKLITVLGFMLGYQHLLLGLFITFILAGFYALVLVIKQHDNLHAYIPFAPFICIGSFISLLYGTTILHYYFLI